MAARVTALALVALSVGCANGGAERPNPGVNTIGGTSADGAEEDTTAGDDDDDDDDDDADTTVGDPDEGSDEDTTVGVPDDPPDLSDGTWVFENVSMTVGISLNGQRAMLDDGREIVTWAQSNPDDISNVNVLTALGPEGWPVSYVTDFDGVQNTFPFLAGGERGLLVWSGKTNPADDYDIWLVRSQGDGWTPAENVSDPFETDPELTDTEPVILRRSDGGVAVVYLAQEPAGVGIPPPPEIFVSKFFEDNEPSGRFELSPEGGNCTRAAGATAPSDVFHVVFACNDSGSTLVHATDRSGDWDTNELAGVTSSVLSPNMGSGPDGVGLVWIQHAPCGADDCDEVFYAATNSDEVFGTPIQVTDTANLNERMPAVGIDPWGRVLVLAQARLDNVARLYLSLAEDGETFGEAERISPDGVDDYQTPNSIGFDAGGNPSFVLEVVEDGSDPLNIEIHRAHFVPN